LVPQEAVVARASRETESGGWTNIRSGTVPAGRSVAAGANPPGAQPPPVPSLSRCRSPSHACCICCAFPRRDGIHGRGATVSSRLAGCRMREAGRLPEDLVRSLEPTDLSFEVLQALALLGRQTRSTSRFTLGLPYPVPERLRRARDLLGDRANPPTCDACSCSCANTSRPARSRTSGQYRLVLFMTPSSHVMESPGIPGRVTRQGVAACLSGQHCLGWRALIGRGGRPGCSLAQL
jgi:hypothetical protein